MDNLKKTIPFYDEQFEYFIEKGVKWMLCKCCVCNEQVKVCQTYWGQDMQRYCVGCGECDENGMCRRKQITDFELPDIVEGMPKNLFLHMKYNGRL